MAARTALSAKDLPKGTPEEDLANLVDSVKAGKEAKRVLVPLLPENHPVYEGKSSNQIIRMRGYLLAAFEGCGTPQSAAIYLLDELQNSRNPYMVAAAAKAVRGLECRNTEIIPYLFKAIENIKWTDDALCFETYKPEWPLPSTTTALAEIFKTFGWFGGYAQRSLPALQQLQTEHERIFSPAVKTELSLALHKISEDQDFQPDACCEAIFRKETFHQKTNGAENAANLNVIIFEDQDGLKVPYSTFFEEKPTVLVFFYTRCDNPNKCSLSVTKLGHLQQALVDAGLEGKVRTAAVTYDSGFDLPFRLRPYAERRGVQTDANNRVFRVDSGFPELAKFLNLGVNFMGSVVTNHKIELYVLDKGKLTGSFQRLQWEVEEVVSCLQKLSDPEKTVAKKQEKVTRPSEVSGMKQPIFSLVWPILVAFFPKCPFCWASYLSVFGLAGLETIPYSPWLLPVFSAMMLGNLYFSFRSIKRRAGAEPFYLSCAGAVFILLALTLQLKMLSFAGLFLILSGSVLNALPLYAYLKLKNLLLKPIGRF
jgi:protein SCO1/2